MPTPFFLAQRKDLFLSHLCNQFIEKNVNSFLVSDFFSGLKSHKKVFYQELFYPLWYVVISVWLILKMVGPKKQEVSSKINILKENHCF